MMGIDRVASLFMLCSFLKFPVSYGGISEFSLSPQDGLKETDKILMLPGQPNGTDFNQYSGYVTVDQTAGRALFYYFAESPHNSSGKPLVLWLDGGPGCSSMSSAFLANGPFKVNTDGITLSENKYAWTNVANVLFLESPAGVGFSYSNTSSDYITGDTKTAEDSYTFLVNWLDRFPEYKTRDFFIAGVSYAGHYVPQLAHLILHNKKIINQTFINLQGIAIGNAYVDYETREIGTYDFLWTHGLISDEIHGKITLNCNFSSHETVSEICESYRDQAEEMAGGVFVYDIYAPSCSSSSNSSYQISEYDPCAQNYVYSYLNIPEVQKSLHANVTGLPGPWNICNGSLIGNWNDMALTVLPTIKELMNSGISVWMYSGDLDAKVSVTATRYAIGKLVTKVRTPWYPWYTQGEVGGYAVGYENLTLVTVRGAGHGVPNWQPARGLALFSSFLAGNGILPLSF